MKKKWFSLSNISNILLIVFILAMVFIPDVKAWTIQNLMKIGLFQPDVSEAPVVKTGQDGNLLKGLRFQDHEGNLVDLEAQKGKVIFINFWATWCPPCIAEMPAIQELYHQFKDNGNVMFIMADMDQDFSKAQAFMKKKALDLPVYGPASNIPDELYTGTLPTTAIFDRSGNLSFHHTGTADYSNPKMTAFIRKLSKASQKSESPPVGDSGTK